MILRDTSRKGLVEALEKLVEWHEDERDHILAVHGREHGGYEFSRNAAADIRDYLDMTKE
jgi:hypothetical protein